MENKPRSRDKFLHWVIAVAAVALIAYFLPRESATSYNYTLGQPWNYSLLTAPFEIPITIDSVRAKAIRDSIDSAFVPVYERDDYVAQNSVYELGDELETATSLLASGRLRLVAEVERMYEDGIVDNDTYAKIAAGELPEVRFVVGNVVQPVSTAAFRSVKGAYATLDSSFVDYETQQAMSQVVISRYLTPNVVLDTVETRRLLDQLYQKALAPVGVLQQGERIIDRGDIVTPQAYALLKEYERLVEKNKGNNGDLISAVVAEAARVAIVIALVAALYVFLICFRREIASSLKKTAFIVLFVVVFALVSCVVIPMFDTGMYLMPFVMIPVMLTTFFDTRTALYTHIIEVLLCSIIVPDPLEFILMQILAGVTAIISIQELSRRSQLVQCAVYVFLVYSFTHIAVHFMGGNTVESLNYRVFGSVGINVVLFSFTYVLIFLVEKIFGFTSTVTLVELSDINSPILRELSEKCPGTFQHSLQMSNLAAEAAHAIGANALLVRAGALYHDIGKLDNPAFFTENQRGENPHTSLPPEVSAQIVIEHVANGVRRAAKAKLPQVIVDFITQHHGCGKAKYFYTQVCNANPDAEIDPAPYTYPGPNPQNRETSILMMADAAEAASRSLTTHTDETIRNLVERIIDSQIADGMFKESPISFRDVEIIKKTFTERLCTMYHTRIAYPEAVKKKKPN